MNLKQLFTQDEIDYLMEALIREMTAGIGPVEKGVPMHSHYKPDRIEFMTARALLAEMEIGESRTIANKMRLRPFVKCASAHGFKIATLRLPLGEYRLWKTGDPPPHRKPLLPLDPHRPLKKIKNRGKVRKLKNKSQKTARNNTNRE